MINRWGSFLADADNKEGVWQVIVLLVLIGISLLTNLLAKIKQKQVGKAKQQPRGREEPSREEPVRGVPRPNRAAGKKSQFPGRGITPASQVPERKKGVPPSKRPLGDVGRLSSSMGSAQSRRVRRATPKPREMPSVEKRRRERLLEDLGEGVITEEQRLKMMLAREQVERQRRLERLKTFKPGIMTDLGPMETHARRIHVDLTNPKAAKAAIIYSEIIGPPKALRTGPESWEWV